MKPALTYLHQDYYLNYPLIKAINHGFDVISADETGVLVSDAERVFSLLSAKEPLKFLSLIPRPEYMEVIGEETSEITRSHFGFENGMTCHQYYYPLKTIESDCEIETATLSDLDFITQHYDLADEQELRETIQQGRLWVARDKGRTFSFIGRHEDGSMGMLRVLPQYRRQGWGERLERALTKIVLTQGDLPYGHVVVGNEASARLQEKLGFICCSQVVTWMW